MSFWCPASPQRSLSPERPPHRTFHAGQVRTIRGVTPESFVQGREFFRDLLASPRASKRVAPPSGRPLSVQNPVRLVALSQQADVAAGAPIGCRRLAHSPTLFAREE